MRQVVATVLIRTVEYDERRTGLPDYSGTATVRGTLLPTGGEIVQKQYGQEYAGEFEFYARQRNAGLVQGSRLRIATLDYDIVAIRDYGKVVTCLLRRVVGEDG